MFRHVTFLVASGLLCVLAGSTDRRVVADDCPDEEPDTTKYCPVNIGDNPNVRCGDTITKAVCESAKLAENQNPNTHVTKPSPGHYSQLQFDSYFPPSGKEAPCYTRRYCTWNDKDGVCKDGKVETVWQYVYAKAQCTKTEQ